MIFQSGLKICELFMPDDLNLRFQIIYQRKFDKNAQNVLKSYRIQK
jgi:hypothetical protein